MTITLDQIRDTKFHVSKRNGYEVTEVDRFVDQVEESFAQLTEENNTLKKQVEALKTAQANAERAAAESKPAPAAQSADEPTQEQPQVQERPAPVPAPEPQAPVAPVPAAAPAAAASRPAASTGTVADGVERIVVTTTPEASSAVVRLVQLHTEQVETMEEEAKAAAKAKTDEANAKAKQITTEAQTRADRLEADARANAEKIGQEARRNADDLGRQVDVRRSELFSDLETERDQLQTAVDQLREYENQYRTTFTDQLRATLESVQGASSEPDAAPSLAKRSNTSGTAANSGPQVAGARTATGGGQTPRLDALLGENKS